MDDDYMATTEEMATFFGVAKSMVYNRKTQLPGHPKSVRDERLNRVFWRVGDMRTFSREFHKSQSSRFLFGRRRLLDLSPEELRDWGLRP